MSFRRVVGRRWRGGRGSSFWAACLWIRNLSRFWTRPPKNLLLLLLLLLRMVQEIVEITTRRRFYCGSGTGRLPRRRCSLKWPRTSSGNSPSLGRGRATHNPPNPLDAVKSERQTIICVSNTVSSALRLHVAGKLILDMYLHVH